MARSNEPFWWAFFSAGGVMAAVFMPVTIFITSVAAYTGMVTPGHLWDMMHTVGFRVYLFFLISLSLFHWAHRFRYTLYDGLQIKHLNELINLLCYGGAIAGTFVAGYLLAHVP